MKSGLSVLIAAWVIATTLLANARSAVTPEPKATAATLQRLEREFMKSVAEKGTQGYLSYYADDAVGVPDGGGFLRGRNEIAKRAGYFDNKRNHMTWTPLGADVATSGDLGYTFGTYEFHGVDKDNKPMVSIGKYTTIWKLQQDGSWKVVLDMANTSPMPGNPQPTRRLPLI
jgi:ketosteroid isomerase-like protein